MNLLDDDNPATSPSEMADARFKLDQRTRRIGLVGVARARAVLEAARRAAEQAGVEQAA